MLIDWGIPFSLYKVLLQKDQIDSEGKYAGSKEFKRSLLILLIVSCSLKYKLIYDKLDHFLLNLDSSDYIEDNLYFSSFPVFKFNEKLLLNQILDKGNNRLLNELKKDIIFN